MKNFKYKDKEFEIIEDIFTDEEMKSLPFNNGMCNSKNGEICFFLDYEYKHCIDLIDSKEIPDCVQFRNNERYHCIFKIK